MLEERLNYYEDVEVGGTFVTPAVTVSDHHVLTFAGLTGDFFELHMDDEAARSLGFDRRVAHGLLGLALVDGLKNRATRRFAAVASMGWDWRFTGPILIGDRLSAEVTVGDKRRTRTPDRGLVFLDFAVFADPEYRLVQAGRNTLMVRIRDPQAAGDLPET